MRIQRLIPAVLAGSLALLAFSTAPALAAPEKPNVEEATEVTATTAVLHGVLNPHSKASTAYSFEYGEGALCEPGERTEFGETEEEALKVSAALSFLAPNREYSFCLRTFHDEEQTNSESLKFKTLPAKPVLEGSPRTSGVAPFKATLEAELRASDETTTYSFTYATNEELNQNAVTLAGTPITGNFLEVAHVETGATLTPGATYYYRITAKNGTGTVESPVEHFTTPPVKAPEVLSETATNVQSTEPRLAATINPEYEETSYSFEYSPSEQTVIEGKGIPVAGAPPAAKLPAVFEETGLPAGPVTLSGVQPGVYYYRVIATNGTGTTDGPVEQFITQGNPLADTGGSTVATEVSAQVAGTVTANGAASTYHFVYIDQQGYEAGLRETPGEPYALAKRAATTDLSEANGQPFLDYTPHAVETQLGELTPGTTYRYALVAENELGRTIAPGQTLTTAGTAPAAPPAEAEIPGPPPQVSPFPAATLPPLIPYTSIAALDAKEAKENKSAGPVKEPRQGKKKKKGKTKRRKRRKK